MSNGVKTNLEISWENFKMCMDNATEDDKETFKEHITKSVFVSVYPPNIINLKDDATQLEKQFQDIMEMSGKDVSQNSKRSTKKLSELIRKRNPNTELEFDECFNGLNLKNLQTSLKSRHTIKFCTESGLSDIGWKDRDWSKGPPSSTDRAIRWLSTMTHEIITPPTRKDLPIYFVSKRKKKSIIKLNKVILNTSSQSRCSNVKWDEFPPDFKKSKVVQLLIDYCAETRQDISIKVDERTKDQNTRNSLYCLAVCDPNAPDKFKWQAYVGIATNGICDRWYGNGVNHFSGIKSCIRNVNEGQTQLPPSVKLEEILLAYLWQRNKSWNKNAMLFFLTDCDTEQLVHDEETIAIAKYNLKDMRYGLNLK